MADCTGGEFYVKHFEPSAYLEDYFKFGKSAVGDEYLKLTLPLFCSAFAPGELKGDTLIDIGTGPTIYQLLSACECFKEITATDYAESNRKELRKWLQNEPGAFDWSPVVKYVCELEENRMTVPEKEEKLRRAVTQILHCDVLKSNPLEPLQGQQYDCVLSSLCLEGACKSKDEVCCALKNISTLSKPGGYLVLCGDISCSYYQVGKVKFASMSFDKEFLRKAVSGAGYTIDKLEVSSTADKEAEKETTDYSGVYFLVAHK
ncbi:nicotinamide N-methyltransferase-like [Pleurodeles waltl]